MAKEDRAPKAMLISFSGIDGAGKSTQIKNVCDQLAASGLTVKLITFWDDVAQLKSLREEIGHKVFRGDRGVGTPDAPIVRRDKNVRSPLVTLFRLCAYVLDAVSLRMKASSARRSVANVVIFDRYLYDEIANLDFEKPAIRLYVHLLLWIVPRPDLAFVLDANPEEAFLRKPEYPLEFLHSNRRAYLSLASSVDGITVIPPLALEEALATVSHLVLSSTRLPSIHRLEQ